MSDLQRLGETREFGIFLLDILGIDGWTITRYQGFAGGVGVTATKYPHAPIKKQGRTLADVATPVFKECQRVQGRWVEDEAA